MPPSSYTVLICTRNRARVLPLALRSHLDLRMPQGVTRDMIVVDNGSTDQTAEVVAAFRREAPFEVRYLREDREGHSIALNTGCRAASGDVICFTDDDAFPDEGWLASIHSSFSEEEADWVFGPVIPRWETGEAPRWFGPETAALVACLDYGPTSFVASDPAQHFAGVNHACRRDLLYELGLYREDLGILPNRAGVSGNDEELYRRALTSGAKLIYNPSASVRHLIPAQRCSRSFHRSITVLVAGNQYRRLRQEPATIPTLFGVPRFWYLKPARHLTGWVSSLLKANPSCRFHHELQFIRSSLIVWHAVADGVRSLFGLVRRVSP